MIKKLNLNESSAVNSDLTDLSEIYSLASDVWTQAQKISDYINKHDSIVDYTDNKLHYVSPENEFEESWYELFLEDEWQFFLDYIAEQYCTTRQFARSNHSFYINSTDTTEASFLDSIRYDVTLGRSMSGKAHNKCTPATVINAYYEAFIGGYSSTVPNDLSSNLSRESIDAWYNQVSQIHMNDYDEDENVFTPEEYVTDLTDELSNYTHLTSDVMESLTRVVNCYQYIDDVKENQENIWHEYLDNQAE